MPFHLTPQQRFQLRRLLRTTDDLGAYRRTLALLQLDRGDTVTDVAAILGVSRRTVHRWIGGYWDHPVPRSLTTHYSTGRPSEWDEDARANSSLGINWQIAKDWSEITRYQRKTKLEAEELHQAVTDSANGVLPWIRTHW